MRTIICCIRGCEFTNSTGTSVTSWTDNGLSDIVFYSNVIHDNGIWDPNEAEGDQDYHGIGIGAKGTRICLAIDDEMYHNSGDGVQVNGSTSSSLSQY